MPTTPEWKLTKYNRLKAAGLCPSCGKPRDSVYLHCAKCLDVYRRASNKWKAKQHPDQVKKAGLKKRYGMTIDEWKIRVAAQGGRCALCDTDQPVFGRLKGEWRVDHNHATGAIRGMLCHMCNQGLGSFKDDPGLLERAATYLRKHKALRAV